MDENKKNLERYCEIINNVELYNDDEFPLCRITEIMRIIHKHNKNAKFIETCYFNSYDDTVRIFLNLSLNDLMNTNLDIKDLEELGKLGLSVLKHEDKIFLFYSMMVD